MNIYELQGRGFNNAQKMTASGEGEEEYIVNIGRLMWHNNDGLDVVSRGYSEARQCDCVL